MTYNSLYRCILTLYQRCNVNSFPIDCTTLVKRLGFDFIAYNKVSQRKQDALMALSPDACLLNDRIYYNPDRPVGRIRFSVMHELGHSMLHTQNETAANYFASHSLAPRMAIHYSHCKDAVDVAKRFLMTTEASSIAYQDYERWYKTVQRHFSTIDKEFYEHFYDPEQDMFVYSKQECIYCDSIVYNSDVPVCKQCALRIKFRDSNTYFDSPLVDDSWLFSE